MSLTAAALGPARPRKPLHQATPTSKARPFTSSAINENKRTHVLPASCSHSLCMGSYTAAAAAGCAAARVPRGAPLGPSGQRTQPALVHGLRFPPPQRTHTNQHEKPSTPSFCRLCLCHGLNANGPSSLTTGALVHTRLPRPPHQEFWYGRMWYSSTLKLQLICQRPASPDHPSAP